MTSAAKWLGSALLLLATACAPEVYDVVVIGGSTSGTTAGIRAARMGARTLIVEEGPWLGGMLTAAGVSATDGNYRLRGGLWGEFRDSLEARYGGAEALGTGWVSNILFEPHVGAAIFADMAAAEPTLDVRHDTTVEELRYDGTAWHMTLCDNGKRRRIRASVTIDATELGDIAARLGVPCDVGMENRAETGEEIAPEAANGIIQDLTMVMVLKDYGTDRTIARPEGYTPEEFACCCDNARCVTPKEPHRLWSPAMMRSYGKLPGGDKYMINWPIEGNDFYVDMLGMSTAERAEAVRAAKARTLRLLYFMQHELGMRTLDLADDEFPTDDLMPLIPYHRESRRIRGVVRFTLNDIVEPYARTLFRTAIGVGDYPVDQHHTRYSGWEQLPDLYFRPVPSYGVPWGVTVPAQHEGLLVAEKSISVSNLANGSTRLQPVVMQIGEAAGITAALAARHGIEPREVSIREVQRCILDAGGYLLPFLDLPPHDSRFAAMQRIGVTGILRGRGANVGWENQTWFRADEPVSEAELSAGLNLYYPAIELSDSDKNVTLAALETWMTRCGTDSEALATARRAAALTDSDSARPLTRLECAVMIDAALAPFDREIDAHGALRPQPQRTNPATI